MSTVKDLPSCNTKRSPGNPNWGAALPYDEVKTIIKPYQFTSLYQYTLWVREMKTSGGGHGLPIHPQAVFSRKGEWVSREDFLGLSPKKRIEKAKSDYQKQASNKQTKYFSLSTIIRQILGLRK